MRLPWAGGGGREPRGVGSFCWAVQVGWPAGFGTGRLENDLQCMDRKTDAALSQTVGPRHQKLLVRARRRRCQCPPTIAARQSEGKKKSLLQRPQPRTPVSGIARVADHTQNPKHCRIATGSGAGRSRSGTRRRRVGRLEPRVGQRHRQTPRAEEAPVRKGLGLVWHGSRGARVKPRRPTSQPSADRQTTSERQGKKKSPSSARARIRPKISVHKD